MTYADAKDEFSKLNKLGELILKRCVCTRNLIAIDFERFYVKPDGSNQFLIGNPPCHTEDFEMFSPEREQLIQFANHLREAKPISTGEWITGNTRRGLFFMEISSHFPSANIDLRDYIKFKPCDRNDIPSRDLKGDDYGGSIYRPTDEHAPKVDFEYPDWICTGKQRIYYLHDTLLPQLKLEEEKAAARQAMLNTMTTEERDAFLEQERKALEEQRRKEEEEKAEEEARKAEAKRIAKEKKEKKKIEKAIEEKKQEEQEEKEKAEQKQRLKKSAKVFWSIYAALAVFLFWWAEAWYTYALVVILLAIIAAIRGLYYMMKS